MTLPRASFWSAPMTRAKPVLRVGHAVPDPLHTEVGQECVGLAERLIAADHAVHLNRGEAPILG